MKNLKKFVPCIEILRPVAAALFPPVELRHRSRDRKWQHRSDAIMFGRRFEYRWRMFRSATNPVHKTPKTRRDFFKKIIFQSFLKVFFKRNTFVVESPHAPVKSCCCNSLSLAPQWLVQDCGRISSRRDPNWKQNKIFNAKIFHFL